jgi:hypothetical protein
MRPKDKSQYGDRPIRQIPIFELQRDDSKLAVVLTLVFIEFHNTKKKVNSIAAVASLLAHQGEQEQTKPFQLAFQTFTAARALQALSLSNPSSPAHMLKSWLGCWSHIEDSSWRRMPPNHY